MNPSVIAIIPAYNETGSLAEVVTAAKSQVETVVVVDDGSTDTTGAVAEQAGAAVLRHAVNRGKGASILTGLDYFAKSSATYAVFLDADNQHDPAEIPSFIRAATEQQADLVVGTRMQHTADMPWLRRRVNQWTSSITSRLARQPIPDSQCGYRLLHRKVVLSLNLNTSRFETETEILIQAGRAGHRIISVPIRTIYLPGRASHIQPVRDTLRFLRLIWKYR